MNALIGNLEGRMQMKSLHYIENLTNFVLELQL